MDKKTAERMTTEDQERCPTCDRIWSDPIGRFCSNSWHLATPDIMRQLQAYREIIKELIQIFESEYMSRILLKQDWEVVNRAKKLIDIVTPT